MWYPMGRRQCYVLLGNEKSDWKVEGFRLYLSMCFYSYNSSEIVSLHPLSLCQWIQGSCHWVVAVLFRDE